MNSIAHNLAATCFLLLSIPILGLGLLEDRIIAGVVGAIVMVVIAFAFFRKGEQLFIKESANRRLFKGNFN